MAEMYVEKLQDKILSYVLMFSTILLVLIVIEVVLSIKAKDSFKKITKTIGGIIIAVLVYASVRIVPLIPDLNTDCIVTKECSSYTLRMNRRITKLVVDVVGEDKNLDLTFRDSVRNFPDEGGAGTVVYAKHSKTFLDYLPPGSTID